MSHHQREVHIINITGYGCRWIANAENVSRILGEKFTQERYRVNIIDNVDRLDRIIRSRRQNIVLINAHGEAIPMHASWGQDWNGYLTRIGQNISRRGWTLTSITGYPFFCYSQGEVAVDIQPIETANGRIAGLGAVLSPVNGQVTGPFWASVSLSLEGRIAASLSTDSLAPENLWISRCFNWLNPSPAKRYYMAGPIIGAGSIPLGRGFLVINGMGPNDFGTNANQFSDEILAKFAFVFTLDTIRRVSVNGEYEFPSDVLGRLKLDISARLPPAFQIAPTSESQVQRQLSEFLRLRYDYLDFRREQVEFPYSTKSYKPDFASERSNIAIEVKFCSTPRKKNKLVDEINADITAYKTHFKFLLFVVYDTDRNIPDPMAFTSDFETNNVGVRVLVIR